MLEVINATNTDATNITEFLATDFTPDMTDPQTGIGEEITNLWVAHANAKIASRATHEELRSLRAKLGEQLCRVKEMLAKPGRAGQWSAFLRERQIPRASADRLVSCHLRLLNPDANRPSEANSASTEDEVQKLFTSVWPKLRRTLRSRQSLILFIDLLTAHCENSEQRVHEIAAVMPDAATIHPVSSDGDSFGEPEFGSVAIVARADEQVIRTTS
jgi:hypothetical protein